MNNLIKNRISSYLAIHFDSIPSEAQITFKKQDFVELINELEILLKHTTHED